MRKRSFHISSVVGTKGNSQNVSSTKDISAGNLNGDGKAKKMISSAKPNLTSIISLRLYKFRTHDNKYNKFISLLSDPYFLIACYREIRGKQGNMTRGIGRETLDGLSWEWFEKVAEELKSGKFKFSVSRRIEIPKPNSNKTRPLTIASPRDKIVQKALQVILEAIWEKSFLGCSHGFRPRRSCHSALDDVYCDGKNFVWVIQGDISQCFPSIPHNIILDRVKSRIIDVRFLELLRKFLQAGHKNPKTGELVKSDVGVPQGGILSPILCNIVMHQFDEYVMSFANTFNKGEKRRQNPAYQKIERLGRLATNTQDRLRYLRVLQNTRYVDVFDPNFRRIRYIRYAGDFVIMIIGTKNEAEMIKLNCKDVLKTKCGVELNKDKTIITHMQEDRFKYLGAEIEKLKRYLFFGKSKSEARKFMIRTILMKAPITAILEKMKGAGFIRQNNQQLYIPKHMGSLLNLSHYDIISFYNSKIHGILNFYSFASNLNKLGRIIWYLKASCALTLARKYKLETLSKVFQKFGKNLKCPETDKEIYQPKNLKVKRQYQYTKSYSQPDEILAGNWASKLTETKFGKSCTLCGSYTEIEMHHLRSVKDVRGKMRTGNTTFEEWTGAMKIKQIPLCKYHHNLYHTGQLTHADIKEIKRYTG
jgi:group II intron reverse transcriptase/maturase